MAVELFIDKVNLALQTAASHPLLSVLVYLASMTIYRAWHSAWFADCWYQWTGGLMGRMLMDVASVAASPLKLVIAYLALFWRMLISFGHEMPMDSAQPPGPPPPEVDQPKDLATETARLIKEVADADAQLKQQSVENAALIEEIAELKKSARLEESRLKQRSTENACLNEEVAILKEKLLKREKTERLIASFKTKVARVPEYRALRPCNCKIIPKSQQYGIFHVSEGMVLEPPKDALKKQFSLSKVFTVADTTPAIAPPFLPSSRVTDNAPVNVAPVLSHSSILIVADIAPVSVAPVLSVTSVFTVTDNAPSTAVERAFHASNVVSTDEDSTHENTSNDGADEKAKDEVDTEENQNQIAKFDDKNEVQKEYENEGKTSDEFQDEREQDTKKDDDSDDDEQDDDHDLGGGAVLILPDHPLSATSTPASSEQPTTSSTNVFVQTNTPPPELPLPAYSSEQPTTSSTNVFMQINTPSTELPVHALPALSPRSPATQKRRLSDPEEPKRSGNGPASRPVSTDFFPPPSTSVNATVESAFATAQLRTIELGSGSSTTTAPLLASSTGTPTAHVNEDEAMEVIENQPGDTVERSQQYNSYLMDGVVDEPAVVVERVAETHDGSMDGVIQQAPPVATDGVNNAQGDAMEVIEIETNQDACNLMERITQVETAARDDQEMADVTGPAQDPNTRQYADLDMHDNFSSATSAADNVDTDMQNDSFLAFTPRQPATQVAIDREIEMDILEDLRPELPATPGEFGPFNEIFDEPFVEAGHSSPPLVLSPTNPDELYAHPPPMPLRMPSPDPQDDLYSLPPSTPPRSPSPDLYGDIYSPPPPSPRRSAIPSPSAAPVLEHSNQTRNQTEPESVAVPVDTVSEETTERQEQTRTETTIGTSTGPRATQQHSYKLNLPLEPPTSHRTPATPMTPTPNTQPAAADPSSASPRRIIRRGPRSAPLRAFRTTKPSPQTQKPKGTGCAKLGPDGRVIRSPVAGPSEAPKTPTSVKVLAPKHDGSAADPTEASPDAPRISVFSISNPQ
ncbi:hypothetical protein CKAH01_06865 [Colletotrichum kahawae]|uniref:Uncharacterized protein n=1 Tax=Colletotrichum kahawae TaxID=34407 RepID=A0AAD9Y648_COLKA|nr:hypothetical protein CKAH01_06865 [Colletotrichum kahawae]